MPPRSTDQEEAPVKSRPTFGLLDLAIFSLVALALVVAAVLSELFVPTPRVSAVELSPPKIEYRDQFYGVATARGEVVWLVGGGGKVLHSDDRGQTWRRQETPRQEALQDVAAWDESRALAVGNDGLILVTEDGGESWREVDAPRSEIVNKLFRIETLPEGEAWAVGAGGMILHSSDYGASWDRRSGQEDVAWNGVDFVDPQRGWVVGEFGRILRTADGGATWEEVDSTVERSLMAVRFRDASVGVAVGLDGLILRSEDGGQTWTKVPSGTPVHLYDVQRTDRGWLAAGDGGAVVLGDPPGSSWEARSLAEHELGWHTEAAPSADGWILVGANQGVWREGVWQRLAG
jgi:photosystem II stability/assembly factor-like uncharacterized protein